MEKLNDFSKMPWGMHKGTAMQDVSAEYLLFMYENGKLPEDVSDYITENLDTLRRQRDYNKKHR